MSWRSIQLDGELCDQDCLILDLFRNQPVVFRGQDPEFATLLNQQPDADNLVLIFNTEMWISEIIDSIITDLSRKRFCTFYIGINRYQILGNDTNLTFTNSSGSTIISLLSSVIEPYDYIVTKSGHKDNDRGKYFNFVQPLTWIYGHYQTN